ncbi:MAG TPA: hypothetical protein VFT55_01830, partial [Planctomycetota bacterium]|nr:hypothetical protein [Planctomycetota bacterium]
MRVPVSVLLLACLAAVAWFAYDNIQPAPIAPATAPTSAATPVPAAAVMQTTPLPAEKEPPTGTAVEAGANQRQAVAPQFTGPVGEVQVVRFDTKAPIAGATVYCWPPDFDWQKLSPELKELQRRDSDEFLKKIGLSLTTDTDGRCRVPLATFGASVTAVKDDLWGQGHLRKDATEPVVVALRVDQTLHVLVVDAGGKPARGSNVMARRKGGDRPMDFGLGATDAAGRVVKRHVQEVTGDAATQQLDLVALMPGGESAPVRVDAAAPPPEVLLQLPPGGTVTVHVRDAEDKPIDPTFLNEPSVSLATFAEKPGNERAEAEVFNRAESRIPLDEGGNAVFSPVAFGRFVTANVGWGLRSAVVPGPTLESRYVELTVREGADDVVLTGTLLDADDRPFATSPYSVACKYKNGTSGQGGRTDASGRFRLAVPRLPTGQQIAVSFDTIAAPTADRQACELPPRLLTKGSNDLGEVRLTRHLLLVEGKVVMADGGEPVQVQFQIERKDADRWQQEWNLWPEWGKAGEFKVRSGIQKGTPIRLVVQSDSFLPVPPIECAAGDTGLEIKLAKGGSARATFLVDATLPLERLTLRFRRADAPPDPTGRAEMMERMRHFPGQAQAKDGRLQRDWQGLEPGRYRLQAMCAGVAEPIVAIDAVEIGDGPCTDPRLVDIDLRGRVRTFEIRATASDGTAVASQDAFVVIRSSGADWSGFNLASGVAKIATPAAVDLIVLAKGHKAALVSGVFDARTIALEAATEAHIALVLPSPLPEGAGLRLRLRPTLELPRRARMQLDNGRGMGAENFFIEEATVDAAGKATVLVRFPGPYTVEPALSFGERTVTIGDSEPRKITLPA